MVWDCYFRLATQFVIVRKDTKDLREHGWVRLKTKNPSMTPPAMTDLLAMNENFRRIFNTQSSYQKYDTPVMQVAMN